MSYISQSLSQGEEICLRAKLHWCCFLGEWFFTILTLAVGSIFLLTYQDLTEPLAVYGLAGFTLLMGYWTIRKWFKILSIAMVITNRRVIYKEGVFAVKTAEILNAKIESVAIEQSILGHILGYANINFSGTGTAHVSFYYVTNPQRIKSEMEYIISKN